MRNFLAINYNRNYKLRYAQWRLGKLEWMFGDGWFICDVS